MKNDLIKKILPHFIAIIVFLLVAVIFCKPVLEGNVLNQHDNVGWKGMAQNAFEYKEKNGHFPLWNPNLFSGMPNYQVAMEGKSILPDLTRLFSVGLPKPINFFFLAALCFYILCMVLSIRPVISTMAGLAYAFATYNPVIIAAGHDTQMLATAYMPFVLAGIISIYEKKYWLGFALTTLGAYLQVSVNHLQVSYYFFLVAGIITVGYLVKWIMEKEWKHLVVAGSITLLAGIIGVAGNALVIKTTSEYSKFTMRGGKDISIEGDTVKLAKTSGLDTGYAFEYSLGKAESATMLMPNAFGGSSNKLSDENSHVVDKLTSKGIDEGNARQLVQSIPRYWGQLYTSGPAYIGVLIFLFGLIGFVIIKNPLRWGLLAATLLGIIMSWGKYLPGFNTFLFEYLPLYNKFRSPAFAQVIPQFTLGIMAAITLQQLLFSNSAKDLLHKNYKKILYAVGGLFALLGIMYITMDYGAPNDRDLIEYLNQVTKNNDEIARAVIAGLKEDRQAMFGGQLLRALAFALIGAGVLYLFVKNKISAIAAAIVLLVVSSIEILAISKAYLPAESYIPADEYTSSNFAASAIDQQIMQDKDPDFRVFNMVGTPTGGTFAESKTSYYFKSVGGYHPAKLRIYQDIIEKYLSGRPSPAVLNMLNAKYIIVQDPQTRQAGLITNPDAFGPCWLVKNVKLVDDRVKAIEALGATDLKDTAIVEKTFAALVTQPQWDSASSVKLTRFENDEITYEANCNGPQFAVFSEVYYPKGWNAYLDGKKTEYVNVNYILRGMSIPAGKHTIKFVFEPASVKSGRSIMFFASILIAIAFLGGLFMAWKTGRKKN